MEHEASSNSRKKDVETLSKQAVGYRFLMARAERKLAGLSGFSLGGARERGHNQAEAAKL
jgi:hypothetical protein